MFQFLNFELKPNYKKSLKIAKAENPFRVYLNLLAVTRFTRYGVGEGPSRPFRNPAKGGRAPLSKPPCAVYDYIHTTCESRSHAIRYADRRLVEPASVKRSPP